MIKIGQVLALAAYISATSNAAFAKDDSVTPESLWMTPLPDVCRQQLIMTSLIVRARDEGINQRDAIERVKSLASVFPERGYELAPDIYRHKELDARDWDRYVMFSCHAHAYGLPALALDTVAKELRECGANFGRDECVVEIRNIITGAPRKYRPPSRMVPTPAPTNR